MALFVGYRPSDGWSERLDPRLKLAWLAAAVSVSLTAQELTLILAVPLSCMALSLAARLPWRPLAAALPVLALVGIQLLVLQLLFSRKGTLLWAAGPLEVYSGGPAAASRATLRFAGILSASLQLHLWLPPADLVQLLSRRVPYRYASLAGLALRFLPEMEREFRAVAEAQAARGLPLGGPVSLLKALIPLTLPFLFRALRRADDVALSLELRGFGACPTRTFLDEMPTGRAGGVAGLLLLTAALIFPFTSM